MIDKNINRLMIVTVILITREDVNANWEKKVIFYNTIMLYTILEVTVFTVKMRAFLEKNFFF